MTIDDIAAQWVVRQDRRLSAAEEAELECWLAADPRHAKAFAAFDATWRRTRSVGAAVRSSGTTVPSAAAFPRWQWAAIGGLAAAVAAALFVPTMSRHSAVSPNSVAATPAVGEGAPATTSRLLPDGSIACLKNGAEIELAYAGTERRVRLVRGEAFFTVSKDPARPFLVDVGDVSVRAVGTAFAIRPGTHSIDVLVTEGTIQVTKVEVKSGAAAARKDEGAPTFVGAGYRVAVPQSGVERRKNLVVVAATKAEISDVLSWGEPMVELSGSTLGEIVAAFSHRPGPRIVIQDQSLETVRIGGRLPLSDPEGFVRALSEIYGVKVARGADGTFVLSRGEAH